VAALAGVVRGHLFTIAACASVDIGAFEASRAAGWIVTGLSLLALDFAVNS
jgi:hypothetical protein